MNDQDNKSTMARPQRLPLDFWIHESFRDHDFTNYLKMVEQQVTSGTQAFTRLPEHSQAHLLTTLLDNRVSLVTHNAFMVPLLSVQACKWILQRSGQYHYSENLDGELPGYRIPEAIIGELDPLFYDQLMDVLKNTLGVWMAAIWNKLPSEIASLQLAKYEPTTTTSTDYHVDRDSEMTAVISLNPSSFTGGGTALLDGPFGEVVVPPLDAGWALVFPGNMVFHRGLPVETGTRDILTLWCK